jgi:hypothetical protein
VSAEATAGIAAIAAPKPNVIADAPTQLTRRMWLFEAVTTASRPPNSAGSARNQERRRLTRSSSVYSVLTIDFITSGPDQRARIELDCMASASPATRCTDKLTPLSAIKFRNRHPSARHSKIATPYDIFALPGRQSQGGAASVAAAAGFDDFDAAGDFAPGRPAPRAIADAPSQPPNSAEVISAPEVDVRIALSSNAGNLTPPWQTFPEFETDVPDSSWPFARLPAGEDLHHAANR